MVIFIRKKTENLRFSDGHAGLLIPKKRDDSLNKRVDHEILSGPQHYQ